MSKPSLLVTGSSGTIGTALIQRLLDDGFDVHGVDMKPNRWSEDVDTVTYECDLLKRSALEELQSDVDIIVHLAANARVHKLVQNPERARDNFEMTFNVLEYARKNNVSGIIFGSSREVYGNKNKIVYSEEDTYIDECESPYTASKVGGEALLNSYSRCYDIDSCILRFSNVYGRYDVSDRVIPLFIAQAANDQDLTVYGDDKVLDFTFIDDCVDGIYRTISKFHKAKGTTFNIASGEGSSLLEIAEYIVEHLSSDSEVRVDTNRTGEVGRYVGDVSKAEKILNFSPEYSAYTDIKETIEWYMEHDELLPEILD